MNTTTIAVRYQSIDHYSQTRRFKTLDGARRYAFKMVGEHAEISHNFHYAVSADGIGKITVSGTDIFTLMNRAAELETL